jgi:hypothetical protein
LTCLTAFPGIVVHGATAKRFGTSKTR